MTEAAQAPPAADATAEPTKQESATPPEATAAPEATPETAPTPEAVRNPDARIKALEEQLQRTQRQRDEARAKVDGAKTVEQRMAELEEQNKLLQARDVLRSAGVHDDELVAAMAPGVMSAEDPKTFAQALAEKLKPKTIVAPRAPSNGAPQPAKTWQGQLEQKVAALGHKGS